MDTPQTKKPPIGLRKIDIDAAPPMPVHRPPSIDEKLIARHISRGDPDTVLVSMQAAVETARRTADEIAKRHEAIMRDDLRTPIARQRAARNMAMGLFKGAADKMERAHAQARTAIAEIEQLAPPPPKNLEATLAAQEIRTLLRAMPQREREGAINRALVAGDMAILSAVLHGHHLASGQGRYEHANVLLRWQRQHYPQHVERRERLVKARDDLERIVHLFVAWTHDLTDAKAIAAAEAREHEARAAEKVAGP